MKIAEITEQQEVPIQTGMLVYHGTPADPEDEDFNPEGFEALKQGRVDLAFSFGGYFGYGFYVTEDAPLARSNYAGREGYVFEYRLLDASRILDLRTAEHFDRWKQSGLDRFTHERAMPARAVRVGIDGIYDRSVGGLCLYNPKILTLVRYEGPLDRSF